MNQKKTFQSASHRLKSSSTLACTLWNRNSSRQQGNGSTNAWLQTFYPIYFLLSKSYLKTAIITHNRNQQKRCLKFADRSNHANWKAPGYYSLNFYNVCHTIQTLNRTKNLVKNKTDQQLPRRPADIAPISTSIRCTN